MKTLTYRVTSINFGGAPQRMDYREQLQTLIRQPANPQLGADFEEIRLSLRVLQAIADSKDGKLQLEDADWEFAKRKLSSMRFTVIDSAVLDFRDWFEHPE